MGNTTGESAQNAQKEKERKAEAEGKGLSTSVGDFWNEMKEAGLAPGGEEYWSRSQIDKAKDIHSRYSLQDGGAWNNLQKIQARDNTLLAEERLNELLGAMVEMQAAQAEALSKKLPYQQPMSNASAAYDASQASAASEAMQSALGQQQAIANKIAAERAAKKKSGLGSIIGGIAGAAVGAFTGGVGGAALYMALGFSAGGTIDAF